MATVLGADRRVVVLAVARMTEAAGNSMLVIALPLYIASGLLGGGRFGLTEALFTGVVLSVTGLMSSLFQPVTGRISDWAGRRKPFVFGGLGVRTVALAGYVVAPTYLALAGLRVLQGFGSSFAVPSALALVSEYSEAGTRGGSMGVYTAFRLVGSLAGIFGAGLLLSTESYTLPLSEPVVVGRFVLVLSLATAGAAFSTLLVGAFVFDSEETEPLDRSGWLVKVFADEDDRTFDPVFVGGVSALFFGVAVSMIEPLQPLVNARLDQSPFWFTLQYGGLILALVVFASPFGTLGDRFGRRPFVVWAWVVLVPATLVQGFVTTPEGMLAARLAQGFAAAMAFAPAVAMVGDVAERTDRGVGTQLAVFSMLLGVGLAGGPLFSGALVSTGPFVPLLDGYAVPFVAAAVLAALAGVLVYTQLEETHEAIVRGEQASIGTRFRTYVAGLPSTGSDERR